MPQPTKNGAKSEGLQKSIFLKKHLAKVWFPLLCPECPRACCGKYSGHCSPIVNCASGDNRSSKIVKIAKLWYSLQVLCFVFVSICWYLEVRSATWGLIARSHGPPVWVVWTMVALVRSHQHGMRNAPLEVCTTTNWTTMSTAEQESDGRWPMLHPDSQSYF